MTEPRLNAEQIAELLRGSEPWLDKRELARHLCCSVRSIQTALAEGMPHAVIFGRVKCRVSEVEPWLEEHGYLVRHGSDWSSTVIADSDNGPAARERPGPGHRRDSFDASTEA
jgi:hypothetical protein